MSSSMDEQCLGGEMFGWQNENGCGMKDQVKTGHASSAAAG